MLDVVLVGIGGCLGANSRFLLATWFAKRYGAAFPYGTLFINVTGSFLFGLFSGLASHSLFSTPQWRLAIAVGFLGGYTTFSTFTYETLTLLREGRFARGLTNMAVSLMGGGVAVTLGLLIAVVLAG